MPRTTSRSPWPTWRSATRRRWCRRNARLSVVLEKRAQAVTSVLVDQAPHLRQGHGALQVDDAQLGLLGGYDDASADLIALSRDVDFGGLLLMLDAEDTRPSGLRRHLVAKRLQIGLRILAR